MFNPYAIIATLVFAIGLFGTGISIGYKWSERSHVADVVAAQNAAIEKANADAEVEKQRALAAAKAEADAKLAARTARLKGEVDAAKKARPECARDAESYGLLLDSIRVANGEKDAPAKLLVPMRPNADANKWFGLGHPQLGISGGGDIRPVSPPTR